MHIGHPEMELIEYCNTQEDSTSLSDTLFIHYLGSKFQLQDQILLKFMSASSIQSLKWSS